MAETWLPASFLARISASHAPPRRRDYACDSRKTKNFSPVQTFTKMTPSPSSKGNPTIFIMSFSSALKFQKLGALMSSCMMFKGDLLLNDLLQKCDSVFTSDVKNLKTFKCAPPLLPFSFTPHLTNPSSSPSLTPTLLHWSRDLLPDNKRPVPASMAYIGVYDNKSCKMPRKATGRKVALAFAVVKKWEARKVVNPLFEKRPKDFGRTKDLDRTSISKKISHSLSNGPATLGCSSKGIILSPARMAAVVLGGDTMGPERIFPNQTEDLGPHQGPTEGTGDWSSEEPEEEQEETGAGPAGYSYQPLNQDPEQEEVELTPVGELLTSRIGSRPWGFICQIHH
ncbi:hypothetical protein STEG23_005482 [Scotinomys teguina]